MKNACCNGDCNQGRDCPNRNNSGAYIFWASWFETIAYAIITIVLITVITMSSMV